MRRRRVADASCRGHEPNVRQTRCRRRSQRVMASRLGFKRWGGSVRGPGAEPSPCRTERTPERSYDALGPRYRRAWKPPFLPRPFMAIDNRYFRSVRVALNVRPASPSILRLCSRRSAGCFLLPTFWLFLLLPRRSRQEHRGREIKTQKCRSHKT